MSTASALAPIPWRFVDTDLAQMWLWETPHFEARVSQNLNSFTWELGDLLVPNQGLARFLAEGQTRDFAEAETAVRETVGKSYPARLGYAPYTGDLATTFTLATGERVNLGEFNGQGVVVTVRQSNGINKSVIGHARVVHWELVLETHGSTIRVQPTHIVSIVREGGGGASKSASDYTGMGRLYRGKVKAGCTGQPGFMPDTIDHTGPKCGVHESGTGPQVVGY